jgi:YgiT-type zinc finger domain-containing protein
MICFFCKGDMISGFTTYTVDVGKSVIIVRHVPCEKCTQCGETVFTGTVVKQLESIVKEMKKTLLEVAIVNYSDQVA